jgi:uncharacterized protein (DUF697 family)
MGAESSASSQGLLDRIAIGISALCLVHCLATAVFVGLIASLGSVLGNPLIHEVGLAIAIALGAVALGRGAIQHRRFVPAAIGGLGLGIMAGALFVPHGLFEVAATMIGVSTLALGHYLNRLALA